MAMSRKHYREFAAVMADTCPSAIGGNDYALWSRLVIEWCEIFGNDNPNFNSTMFINACFGDKEVTI